MTNLRVPPFFFLRAVCSPIRSDQGREKAQAAVSIDVIKLKETTAFTLLLGKCSESEFFL
jgi:hypothetical protein